MLLNEIHARLSNTVLLFTIAMAVWGLWRFFRRQGVDSSYWGALVIAEVLFLVQAALGAFLYFVRGEYLGNPFMHILYGIVGVLAVPGVFIFTRGDDQRRAMLIYGLIFVSLIGIFLRSSATGG